ncbi:MAG: type II toxin-antitoxin system RelE/ParE family toxin [Cyanobacteria bacterium J06588_5]
MTWKITFYSTKVEQDTLNFPSGILANFLRIAEMMKDTGPSLGKPYTAPMGKGLFEIRARGKEGIGRSLYCTIKGEEIIILHSFVKKNSENAKKSVRHCKKKNERGNIMSRPTFEAFKTKALANSEVRKEYEALSVIYDLRKKLIELRKESGLTQEELAQLLKTKKSNISRLENVESHASPKLSTIAEYAKAMGHKVEINFVPIEFSS